MIPTVGVDILVSLADKLSAPLRQAEDRIAKASDRMNKRLELSLKLAGGGAAAAGVAYGAQRLVTGFTNSIREVERAKGELATLGVQDLDAVVQRGYEMQTELAGVTADAFVRASYDIKSGISSLTDQGVADMTASAMMVAKATKGEAEQATSLLATSYGIFKDQYAALSDAEFGDMFGAALSASVQQFKTDGVKMQMAIESAGAGAVNLGMKMTEQLTLLGMMQQQMSAGEAGTALKSFANKAAEADAKFAELAAKGESPIRIRLIDENGQLRAMPSILDDITRAYGPTLTAQERLQIQQALGSEEAIKLIDALYGKADAVRTNADALENAADKGAEFTMEMARAADNNWDAAMILMSQKMDVLRQKIGERLLPVVERLLPVIDAFMARAFKWIDANPELVTGIGAVVAGLGAVAAVASPLLLGMGSLIATWATVSFATTRLGLSLLGLLNPIRLVRGAFMLLRGAFLFSGIGLIVAGLGAAAAVIYRNWDRVKEVFAGLGPVFDGVVSAASAAFSGNWEGVWAGARSAVDGFASWWDGLDFAGKGWIDSAVASVRGFASGVTETVSGLAPAFDGVVSAASAAFSGDWDGVWTGARTAVDGFATWWDGLDFAGKGWIDSAVASVQEFVSGVSDSMSGLAPAFNGVVSAASAAFSGDWDGVWTSARTAVDGFASWWDGLDFAGKGWIDSAVASVQGFVSGVSDSMSGLAPAFDGVVSAASAAFSGDWEGVWAGARSAVDGFATWWDSLDFAGKGAIEEVISAMSDFAEGVSASFAPAVQSLKDAWAQVGPVFSNLGEAFSSLVGAFSGGEGDPAVKLGRIAEGLGKLAGLGIQALATGIEAIARGIETVTGVIAGALQGDMSRVMGELREFFDWVVSGISVPQWMKDFSFADMFSGLSPGGIIDSLKSVLSFSWSDVLPDWYWEVIIPGLPDLKSMFGDASESIDLRLESRAGTGLGEWKRGMEMVEEYRKGLISLADMRAELVAKTADAEGEVFPEPDIVRAREMLDLLREIEAAQDDATAAPQIDNPETLLQAARAATELETRFPAITTAANETLTAVQAVIDQIVTLVQGTDLTTEGARIAGSIAAGIRSQIGAVSAAAAAMSASIRSALPGNANVDVALAGAPAPVQARAGGGWYNPGWLLTGEQGPELRYATEGGFIAHNRALRGMLDMASRTRDLISGIGFDGPGVRPVPALATVAAAAGPTVQRGPVTLSPQYNMPMSFKGAVDMEEVRATVRQELLDAEERQQVDLRRLLHD